MKHVFIEFAKIIKGGSPKIIQWVFGLKSRNDGAYIIVPVVDRKHDTLTKIIQMYCPKGSTIYSDCFSSYFYNRFQPRRSLLEPFGYIHYGVNHSVHFVDQENPHIYTNGIERVWGLLKKKFNLSKPTRHLEHHISEFLFQSWVRREDRFEVLLKAIKDIQDIDL